jgi:hypothetical protein
MTLYDAFLRDARLLHTSSALSIAIGRPAPWIFLSRVEGHLNLEGARLIDTAVRAHVASESRYLVLLNDWSQMSDYDGTARVLLTDLARHVLPACEGLHILVGSRLVAFGVQAANLILRKITVHTDRDPFASAVAAVAERPTAPRGRSTPPR